MINEDELNPIQFFDERDEFGNSKILENIVRSPITSYDGDPVSVAIYDNRLIMFLKPKAKPAD